MPELLPEPAVPVAYDLALWFLDRARAADGHLPAQKLQNLLYLASIHYEHANGGRPLAPFAFVANDVTVADPNLYRLLEDGRPKMRAEPVPTAVEAFLGDIWGRYGHTTVERLNALVRRSLESGGKVLAAAEPIAEMAVAPGRAQIPLITGTAPAGTSATALRPTHKGRTVAVSPWRPPAAAKTS